MREAGMKELNDEIRMTNDELRHSSFVIRHLSFAAALLSLLATPAFARTITLGPESLDGFVAPALVEAAFQQQPLPVDLQQIHGAGGGAGRAVEVDSHGARLRGGRELQSSKFAGSLAGCPGCVADLHKVQAAQAEEALRWWRLLGLGLVCRPRLRRRVVVVGARQQSEACGSADSVAGLHSWRQDGAATGHRSDESSAAGREQIGRAHV